MTTRGQLKTAVETKQWDLLDKLLEADSRAIDDNRMFTDTWGEWWGLLVECVKCNCITGVRILLKHGANRKKGSWGDCIPTSPVEFAQELKHQEILDLLNEPNTPIYERKTDPDLPEPTPRDEALEAQSRVADETGLVFQVESFEDSDDSSPGMRVE